MVDIPVAAWMAAGLVFLAVGFGTISVVLFWETIHGRFRSRDIRRQLERLSLNDLQVNEGASALFRRARVRGPWWVEFISARVPHLADIEVLIEQANLTWTKQTFLVLSGGFGLAFGLGALVASGQPLFVLGFTLLGSSLPYIYVRQKKARRMYAFEEGLPEAIDLLGRALRAGHPLSAGLRMAAEETSEPIAGEFRRVFEEQRFGLALSESLLGMADRIPLMDVRIFVTAVLIQREVGGNLAEILDKLSYVIRQRFSIMRQLRTFTAQGRMSGFVLGGLPIFLGVTLFILNREDMIAFVVHPLGRVLMMVAVFLQIVGFFWISRIIKIDV
jgi:tight adherence protein B